MRPHQSNDWRVHEAERLCLRTESGILAVQYGSTTKQRGFYTEFNGPLAEARRKGWGPDQLTPGVDTGYLDFINQTVADALREASANLQPAEIRFARRCANPRAPAPRHARSRAERRGQVSRPS